MKKETTASHLEALTEGKKRLEWMDVAKGIGIFLVVYAHAHGPHNLTIYLFHMPLFFFLSGYLYNSRGTFLQYLWKKVKSLYIPFVGWNIIEICARQIPTIVKGEMTRKIVLSYLKRFLKIMLTVNYDGNFMGATWFLGALFLVSVIYKFFDVFVNEGKYKRLFITSIFVAAGLTAFYIDPPFVISRTVILSMFYALGCLLHEDWKEIEKCICPVGAAAALFLLVWIGTKTKADMFNNEYTNILLFLIAACLGTYATICIAHMICSCSARIIVRVKQLFSWWGKRSIDIVIWHFIMFRIVSIFQYCYIDGESFSDALSLVYQTKVYISSGGWWAVYTTVGIFASLMWVWLLRQGIWGKVLKKLYLVR